MNRIKPLLLAAAAAMAVATLSCSSRPDGIPDEKEMASLMADVYRGESVIDFNHARYNTDSARAVVRNSVLAAHGMDKEQFDSAVAWYGRNLEKYMKVCDEAVKLLEKDIAAIPDDETNQLFVAGDTANVWPMAPYRIIDSRHSGRNLTFAIQADDTWEPGDKYELEFKLAGINSTVYSGMAVEYDDGGTEYAATSMTNEGWNRVNLPLDSTRNATLLYGYIEFEPIKGETFYVDSIALMRTRCNQAEAFRRRRVEQFNPHNTK